MATSVLVAVLLSLHCFCIAQEIIYESDCDEAENCTEVINCISYYDDLQFHVLSNKETMRNLKEAFFRTGEDPSEFVKITYHFQLSSNSFNDTNSTDAVVDDNSTCFNQTSSFIWSDSAIFLFGPRLLLWYTLFAINIPETSVSVHLPCLCNGANESLLNRFSYLVR